MTHDTVPFRIDVPEADLRERRQYRGDEYDWRTTKPDLLVTDVPACFDLVR